MVSWFKRYFIPNSANGYRPAVLETRSVLVVVAVVLFLQITFAGNILILRFSDYLAAIFPSVLVDLANESRSAEQLGGLTIDPLLTEAARRKAEDMATKGYFAHTSPDGLSPWHWFSAVGYTFQAAGENLAIDFYDSANVHRAWMNSPGHRANILKSNFTEIGIGMAEGTWKDRRATFIVELFGRPLSPPLAVEDSDMPTLKEIIEVSEESSPAPEEARADVLAVTASGPKMASTEEVAEEAVTDVPENDMFIEVVRTEAVTTEGGTHPRTETRSAVHSSALARVVSMPSTIAFVLFSILGLLVTVALVLKIAIYPRIQHRDLIVNGGILLFVISTFIAANSLLLLSGAVV